MRSTVVAGIFVSLFMNSACAQMGDKAKRASPPATSVQQIGNTTVSVQYSQPSVNDREIFGELVPYDKVWRTGANEATTFSADKDVTINGKTLPAGTYALFTIPNEEKWTLIFNKEAEQWGAYKYDPEKDVLRVKATPVSHDFTETMVIAIHENGKMTLDWATTRIAVNIAEK